MMSFLPANMVSSDIQFFDFLSCYTTSGTGRRSIFFQQTPVSDPVVDFVSADTNYQPIFNILSANAVFQRDVQCPVCVHIFMIRSPITSCLPTRFLQPIISIPSVNEGNVLFSSLQLHSNNLISGFSSADTTVHTALFVL